MANSAYSTSVAGSQVAPAGARLIAVNVCTATATAVITVYNGTSTSGAVVAVINGATLGSYQFGGIRCPNGIYVDQTVAASKYTVTFE